MSQIYDQLIAVSERRPTAAFVIEADTGRAVTYREGLRGVAALQQLLGPTPRRIAVTLPNGIVDALMWLAAISGGHLLIPLPPDAPAAERRRLAERFGPDTLVVEHMADAADFDCPGARVIDMERLERAIGRDGDVAVGRSGSRHGGHGGRVCLMTSGSTGEPKGVILDESQVIWTAHHIAESHRLTEQDCGLTVLPFSHVNAPVVSLCASLMAGSTVVVARRFSRTRFWSWVERYDVTWASIVPTILAMLLQTERPRFLPGKLRFVRTASAPLPVVHLRAFEHRFGIPVIETYGLSEAASQVTANPVPPDPHKAGSVGVPVGVELRVCRRQHADTIGKLVAVPRGEEGEICVRGPSVISAYANDADPSAFVDGWFRTGDLGYQDNDGYVFITGRSRDVIIRGGENIAPREVEDVLLSMPGVREAGVVGKADPVFGQRVVAYVVMDTPWIDTTPDDLRAFCATRLSGHKVPEVYIPVESLPRTRSGKIQHHVLRSGTMSVAVG